jgi:hypothetical protein
MATNVLPTASISKQKALPEQLLSHFWVTFLFSFVLINARCPDALFRPQFFGEDGSVFYAQQFGHKWPLLFSPYAGYLHFAPRLIAWLASGVEPARVPLVYNLSAITIQALCIAYAVRRMAPTFGVIVSFLAFFLTPNAGDLFGITTNIQWISQFALIFAVLESKLDRPYRIDDGIAAILVLIASLTGPFSIINSSFIILAWLLGLAGQSSPTLRPFADPLRRIASNIEPTRLAALLAGASMQLVTITTTSTHIPTDLYFLTDNELMSFGLKNVYSFYDLTIRYWNDPVQLLLFSIYGVIFILALIAAVRQPEVRSVLIVVLLCTGFAQPVLNYITRQHNHMGLSPVSHYNFFLGVISFCSIATILLSIQVRPRWMAIAAASFLVILLVLGHPEYFVRPALTDMNWPLYAAKISRGDRIVVAPINPRWRAVITADQ